MTTTEPVRNEVSNLEAELARRFRGQVQGLRLSMREESLVLDGVAVSFHAVQLVLRDALASRVAARIRNQITVRSGHTN
jgi:hypothetical protein